MAETSYLNLASLPRDEVYVVLKKSVAQALQDLTDDQLLAFIKRDAQEILTQDALKKVA
jgi:uncharacterized ferredoxin-like protein